MTSGIIIYLSDNAWNFRYRCFVGRGCSRSESIPTINEHFSYADVAKFKRFLDIVINNVYPNTVPVSASDYIRSKGGGKPEQIKALRYRSVLMACKIHGWPFLEAVIDAGLPATYFSKDPVFLSVSHPLVLENIAEIAARNIPNDADAIQKFLDYVGISVARTLTTSIAINRNMELAWGLYVRHTTPPFFFGPVGKSAILHAAWIKQGKDLTESVADEFGIKLSSALTMIISFTPNENAISELVKTGVKPDIAKAFETCWLTGNMDQSMVLSKHIDDVDVETNVSSVSARNAYRLAKRIKGLESILSTLLYERMKYTT